MHSLTTQNVCLANFGTAAEARMYETRGLYYTYRRIDGIPDRPACTISVVLVVVIATCLSTGGAVVSTDVALVLFWEIV